MNIRLNDQDFFCQVNFIAKRKTLLLRFIDNKTLEIKAPKKYPLTKIHALLLQKTAWILAHAKRLAAIDQNPLNQTISDGATILFKGTEYRLRFYCHHTCNEIRLDQLHINLYFDTKNPLAAEILLRNFFIESAKELFGQITQKWALKLQVSPRRIALKNQKTIWGSCSSSGTISYNWQLIMAPQEVVEYLVIHELSHMREANHSYRFWQLVGRCDPLYQSHRTWLKENGLLLKRLFAQKEEI